MTKEEFIQELRDNRSKLTAKKTVDDMEFIYDNASTNFIWFMLYGPKNCGMDKGADIAGRLSLDGQEELVAWFRSGKATIKVEVLMNQVDLIEAEEKAAALKAKLSTGIAK